MFLATPNFASASQCFGNTQNGRLEGGVKLPFAGKNFVSYSRSADLAGRTYVHQEVATIVTSAYGALATSHPNKVFKYAETGFKQGGQFKPHKTHRNGLSVDFMVPVLDAQGRSVHLPTHLFNRLGYDLEFDHQGRLQQWTIDFEALAAHLVALHQAATAQGRDLQRVIFDPKLQPQLLATKHGDYLSKYLRLSKRQAWVRHDEHYHVDFVVPCLPMN